jgi:lipopolysaccharide export system protein LptA
VYELKGNAVIDDLVSKSHVDGDLIFLDMTTGNVNVKGNKQKPVKFIYEMEKKE